MTGQLTPALRMDPKEIRARTRKALLLALASTLLCLPMYYHQFKLFAFRTGLHEPTSAELMRLTASQAFLQLMASILCCMVGLLYAQRLGLPGLGRMRDFKTWAPIGLAAGLILAPAAWFISDSRLIEQTPELFPRPWPWALAWSVGLAVSQEVVGRLGLLTIGVYFLRWFGLKGHPWPAILVTVLFSIMSSLMFQARFSMSGRIEPGLFNLSLVSTAAFQWIYGEAYVRKGFIAALCLHLGASLKLVVFSFLAGPAFGAP